MKNVKSEEKERARREVEDVLESKIAPRSMLSLKGVAKTAHYIRYEPNGMQERVVKIQEVQQDPLKPPSFRLKKVSNEVRASLFTSH